MLDGQKTEDGKRKGRVLEMDSAGYDRCSQPADVHENKSIALTQRAKEDI